MRSLIISNSYSGGLRFFVTLFLLLHCYAIRPASCESIVDSLPGFGPLPFKLETGYVGVDEMEEVQLFYYFVQSENDPARDPLLLWLTGGPGCSAISGLIYEIGPLRFNKIKYNGTIPSLTLNPYSWTKVSSIIFIDAPVGTGFSYSQSSRGYKTGDKLHAHQCYSFLKKWLFNHPSFTSNPVYIGCDSYSGMIVPLIVQEILDERKNSEYGLPINFKGYLLGNPLTDSYFDENSKVQFAYRMALITEELYKSAKRNCRGDYVKGLQSSSQCARDIRDISKLIERVNHAHILEPKCRSIFESSVKIRKSQRYLLEKREEDVVTPVHQIPEFHCREYFDVLCDIWANDPRVEEALHIRKGTLRYWTRCNRSLDYVQDVSSTLDCHRHLNADGCRILIYSGDHDMVIPYSGTLSWIKNLNLEIMKKWRPWFVDDQVAGYVTEFWNNFTFATVKGGGHTAPEYLPICHV